MTIMFSFLLSLVTFTKFGLAIDIVLTVNPAQVEAKRQEAVILDCQGNTTDLSVYITNRVRWKHVANDGTTHMKTIGFYMNEEADKTKYAIELGKSDNSDTNYSFKLKILSVDDDDDGKYVCINENRNLTVLSSKEVPFTVLNPVEKVKLELLTIMTGQKVYSESQIMQNSVIYKVEEGDYEVTCTAEGSNPNPQMSLKFNNNVQQVETTMQKSFVGNRPSYNGTFSKVISLIADKSDTQTIECSGGIPRKQFPDKYAGLRLKVLSVVFEVDCENVSALVNYRNTELTCKLSKKSALDCSRINWVNGYNNFTIYPGNQTQDSSYGIVIARCNSVTHDNGTTTVTTTLTFELVQDIHFHTVFHVKYSLGSHEYTSPPVKFYMKAVSAAVVVKPFGILLFTLLAFFVRRISSGL